MPVRSQVIRRDPAFAALGWGGYPTGRIIGTNQARFADRSDFVVCGAALDGSCTGITAIHDPDNRLERSAHGIVDGHGSHDLDVGVGGGGRALGGGGYVAQIGVVGDAPDVGNGDAVVREGWPVAP